MIPQRKAPGFTLIEVIIAMMIMTFLSLFTAESIRRALKSKTKIQTDIDKSTTVRDALRVMERDINMAFNYRDPSIEVYNQAQKARQKAGSNLNTPGSGNAPLTPQQQFLQQQQQQQQQAQGDAKYKLKVEKIATQFVGEAEAIHLTTLSNVRLSEESKTSTQSEVGYRIKSCRRRTTQEQSSKCLWRRVSPYFHEDITKEGTETVLLENVQEFKLRYLGPTKDGEWLDQWSSGPGADDTTKGVFPYAVEITIEVKDTGPNVKDKTLRMTTVAAIRNPNNPKKETPDGEPTPGGPPAQ